MTARKACYPGPSPYGREGAGGIASRAPDG